MKDGALDSAHQLLDYRDARVMDEPAETGLEEERQRIARKIAVETRKLWREAQAAGLDELASLMEQSFYRAYQRAGGPKAMRAV